MQGSNSRPSLTDPVSVTDLGDAAAQGDNALDDEASESELPVPEGELLGGRYLVERVFAQGGMGIVCYGRHIQLEQPVAIKFLRRALSGKPSVVERFLNEGRALAALRSEHVVRVMDVGQLDSGRPYLVMEHLDGIDLEALVEREGPLGVETAVDYALQVCEPLAEAHALGIVHRDIKPENLFLWTGGPRKNIVKVLDFGLAKQFGAPRAAVVTGPQDSMGSPCYMSPEQITTPQSIDLRTDIWSLGVVLHHLLTGTLPFDGGSVVEVISHVLSAAPISLREARPELNLEPDLAVVVQRCLEKDRAARYQTMAELEQALSSYLERRASSLAITGSPMPLTTFAMPRTASAMPRTASAPRTPTLEATASDAPVALVSADARNLEAEDEEIRIAGVRNRWPAVLILGLGLVAAGMYQAERSGKLRIRELAESTLMPEQLTPDSVWTVPDHFESRPILSRGVYAAEPTHEASGEPALRAEPERESEMNAEEAEAQVSTEAASPPLTDAERAAKEAAYREYLKREGLTPIGEALKELGED